MASSVDPAALKNCESACLVSLTGSARSSAAAMLVQKLLDEAILPHRNESARKKNVGDATRAKLQKATAALLADLTNLARPGRQSEVPLAGAHGMSRSHFSSAELGFGYDIFVQVVGGLEAEGLLARRVGYPRWGAPRGQKDGMATCFLMTELLLERAAAAGVLLDDWATHWTLKPFIVSGNSKRLELRAQRKAAKGAKLPSVGLPVDLSEPRAAELDAQIARINRFLLAQNIDGLSFRGLRRIFNDGDQPDFSWNKGGRFYTISGGQAYERWSSDVRQRLITIDGERVAEVDLRASHLTLLHGLAGQPMETTQDPYTISGLPRTVVKLWIAQAIGSSNPRPSQWSKKSRDGYAEALPGCWLADDYPIAEVRAAVTNRHPLLIDLKALGYSTLDLQYHEAEILRLAMEHLMFERDIPVLPIHDALIASHGAAGAVEDYLKCAFKEYVEDVTGRECLVVPQVSVKQP